MRIHFRPVRSTTSAFTMVEIALCLAIVGFALVAIIGVLPAGLNVQRENREETIINQDSTVWLEAIRAGAASTNLGTADELTNYVDRIVVTSQNFDSVGNAVGPTVKIVGETVMPSQGDVRVVLDTGAKIIGLMGTPRIGGPLPNSPPNAAFTTNNVIAYVRAFSGTATEKPAQANSEVRDMAFAYRMVVETVPSGKFDVAGVLTNSIDAVIGRNLTDVRLVCRWPLKEGFNPTLPLDRPRAGTSRMTFRAQFGGRLDAGAYPFFYFKPNEYQ